MNSDAPDRSTRPVTDEAELEATPPGDLTLLALLITVLRNARLLVVLPLTFGAMGLVVAVVTGPRYTARSSFLPQASQPSALGQYAGLAAQFGVEIPRGGAGESVDFYARLLRSSTLLKEVVTTEFSFPTTEEGTDTVSGTLMDVWGIEADREDVRLMGAIRTLRGGVAVETDAAANIVTVETTARWAGLSIQLNQRLMELLQDFNLTKRRSRAAEERAFVEERLKVAGEDLRAAEQRLQHFLETNRDYQNSPELSFEAGRLERRLAFNQQVYSALVEALEQARIEEVRNTPVITVIDEPDGLVTTKSPLVLFTLLGFGFGGLAAIAVAFTGEFFDYQRSSNPGEYGQLVRAWRSLRSRLPWPGRS